MASSDSEASRLHSRTRANGDKLILRGLRFHGYHGVLPEERKLGQKFVVDIDAWIDLRRSGVTDQLDDSASYAEIYRLAKLIVEGPPYNLLESVAHNIACVVLQNFPTITDVRVRVCKPHVAVEGVIDSLGVEIFRSSADIAKKITSEDPRSGASLASRGVVDKFRGGL